jgi:hypothetical protein
MKNDIKTSKSLHFKLIRSRTKTVLFLFATSSILLQITQFLTDLDSLANNTPATSPVTESCIEGSPFIHEMDAYSKTMNSMVHKDSPIFTNHAEALLSELEKSSALIPTCKDIEVKME